MSDRLLKRIIRETEAYYRVPRGSILQSTRGSPNIVLARRVAMWLYKQVEPAASWSHMGRKFGRDRSTVREGVEIANVYHRGPQTSALRARLDI